MLLSTLYLIRNTLSQILLDLLQKEGWKWIKYQQHTVRFRNGAEWPSGVGRWLSDNIISQRCDSVVK
jgi:hypothetical protein